jgi:D-sedoheptulose 7-phosphate isomerase
MQNNASLNLIYANALKRHIETVRDLTALESDIIRLAEIASQSLKVGCKIILFGNGGSAADAQHIATELTVQYRQRRPALAAIALTTDTSTLTACANDFGFDAIFSRQIEAIGKPGDLAIGITTSGSSPNVINGLKAANERGLRTSIWTSSKCPISNLNSDSDIVIPSTNTARIQEMHIFVGHVLCSMIERLMNYVTAIIE